MDWHFDPSRPPRTEGWLNVLAPLAALKLTGLKLPAIFSAPLMPVGLVFAASYAVTAGSFFRFAGLCASHGIAIGVGGATTYLAFRKQAAAGLEKLDRERAAFEKQMADGRLNDEIVRKKLRTEADAENTQLLMKAENESRRLKAESEALAFTIREQAERGSTLMQLREAKEQITANGTAIDELRLELAEQKLYNLQWAELTFRYYGHSAPKESL